MLNVLIIITAIILFAVFAFSKRLAGSSDWKATVTPLASIMGSGFLVSAPLLAGAVGEYALVCMAGLLIVAYLLGGVMRFNIGHFEPIENDGHGPAQSIAYVSRIVLSGAYFISVTYYLELLAAFVLKTFNIESQFAGNGITTLLLIIIGGIGMWKGLKTLEAVEKYAVAFNLGMIGALIFSLAVYNGGMLIEGTWSLPSISSAIDLHDVRVLLGLLIIVQGFEISRYLGDEHPAEQRIKTMRAAQLISTVVYLLFIALVTVLFQDGLGADVTAIIDMIAPVALVLPILLAAAAIGSQFSAGVADFAGAGGLIEDITHHRPPVKYAYLFILIIAVTLTWSVNVNEIIAYSSRAFALFYMLQCIVAFIVALQTKDLAKRSVKLVTFSFLAVVSFLVFAFGIPSG